MNIISRKENASSHCRLQPAIVLVMLFLANPALTPGKAISQKSGVRVSMPYTIVIELQHKSPFVPDGRMSLAEFSFRVVFSRVTFEFNPDQDPVLGRCQINSKVGKGEVTSLVLNDVQEGDTRDKPWFTRGPTKTFTAQIDIASEPSSERGRAPSLPPNKVNLAFWTDFSPEPTEWGSKLGSNALANLKIEFEAPFARLMLGQPGTIRPPYEGTYPEDNGAWKIEFKPEATRK